MPSLVILGAGGFLGRELLASADVALPIKAVARAVPFDVGLHAGVAWHAADLLAPGSLDSILERDDVVINLAYIAGGSTAENLRLVENVVDACIHYRVARLVHCSTAVVAGAALATRVTEATVCVPHTSYEMTKLAVEERALRGMSNGLDVGILRPTGIVGPGGQNLAKLAESLQRDNRVVTYLRACLFGRRPMHLVPVRTVAMALIHLGLLPGEIDGNVYIVSSDRDPDNNFRDVEALLLRSLDLPPRVLPLLPMPKQLLSLLLRLRGRSDTNMEREFSSEKLLATNFTPVDSVGAAVSAFAESLRVAPT